MIKRQSLSTAIKAAGLSVLAAGVLAACGEVSSPFDNSGGERAVAAQRDLVGLPETELRACAGEPDGVRQTSAGTELVYVNEQLTDTTTPSLGAGFGTTTDVYSDGSRFGVASGRSLSSDLRSFYCEATFTIRNGTVTGLEYATPAQGSFSRLNQCYSIVAPCLN